MTFTEYCAKEGVHLLSDDLRFLTKHLKQLPKTHRKAIMVKYVEIWRNIQDECKSSVKASNEGRKAANLFILGGFNAI